MPSLSISKASSFAFKVNTGANKINTDTSTIEDPISNYLFADAATFFNCSCLQPPDCFMEYLTTDTPLVQVNYDNSSQRPLLKFEEDGGTETWYYMTNINGDYYQQVPDLASIGVGCYTAYILSYTAGSNIFSCGDTGDFEVGNPGTWNIDSGGNTQAKDATLEACSGSNMMKVTSSGSPVAADQRIAKCNNSLSLSTGTVYLITGKVLDEDANPFTVDDSEVKWDVSEFSDATVLGEGRVTPSSDGRDILHEVWMIFQTDTDVTGQIELLTDQIPQAAGNIFVDCLSIQALTGIEEEAESEPIKISASVSCMTLVEWWHGSEAHNQYYDGTDTYKNQMRIPDLFLTTFGHEDEQFEAVLDAGGTTTTGASRPQKIYPFVTGELPAFMIEKLMLAMKHSSFRAFGFDLRLKDPDIDPDWTENGLTGQIQTEVYPGTYSYQSARCS